jgi:uncharacterized integral membrane protein
VASQSAGPPSGFQVTPRMIGIAAIAVAAILFVVLNRDSVELSFIFFRLRMPVWVAFTALLLIGAAIGYFVRGARDKRRAGG